MKISALTTCVGEKYADYLKKSLPIWLDTCDDVSIVTDAKTFNAINPRDFVGMDISRLYFGVSDVFTLYGASFNKGAALSFGFAKIVEPDWILNFDADIMPPKDWRAKVEKLKPLPGFLYGCSHRYREDGSQIPDADFPNIWGFFHLWNVNDRHSWRRPVYDCSVGHAGNYDHTFMTQWPEKDRVDLWPDIKLIHQGEPRQSWFGTDPQNARKMANLFTLGLYEAWTTKAGHIKVPKPLQTVTLNKNDPDYLLTAVLEKYTDPDPFKYRVEIK